MESKDWRNALDIFLVDWKKNPDVTGAMVCGSYITGNPSSHSDIDLHLILKNDCTWRERGNKIIDGFLIEYFANPAEKHKDYENSDFLQRKKLNAHMFATGEILFDNTGDLAQIVERSRKLIEKTFPKPENWETELLKYHIWDSNDNLQEILEADRPDFSFVYHNSLNSLVESYGQFLGYPHMPIHKLWSLSQRKAERKKYLYPEFPDQDFIRILSEALSEKDISAQASSFSRLTIHVLQEMGGFDIDGWKLHSQL
jgi:hypothetical protein